MYVLLFLPPGTLKLITLLIRTLKTLLIFSEHNIFICMYWEWNPFLSGGFIFGVYYEYL